MRISPPSNSEECPPHGRQSFVRRISRGTGVNPDLSISALGEGTDEDHGSGMGLQDVIECGMGINPLRDRLALSIRLPAPQEHAPPEVKGFSESRGGARLRQATVVQRLRLPDSRAFRVPPGEAHARQVGGLKGPIMGRRNHGSATPPRCGPSVG